MTAGVERPPWEEQAGMFQRRDDDWHAGSPSGAQYSLPSPDLAWAATWRRGSAGGQAFRSPVGGPLPWRFRSFAPVGAVVSINGNEHTRCLLGGALLQRRPIGLLRSMDIQLSAFSSQFLAFSFTIVMCRRHDGRA